MSALERLRKDMREVALFNKVFVELGPEIAAGLVRKHPELRRVRDMWRAATRDGGARP